MTQVLDSVKLTAVGTQLILGNATPLSISSAQSTPQTLTIPNITSADNMVTAAFTQTLTNKSLDTGTTLFTDTATPTKTLAISTVNNTGAFGLTLATAQSSTQTLSVPNVASGDSVTTINATQTLTNKSLTTNSVFFTDSATPAKRLAFSTVLNGALSTLTIATQQASNVTLSIPNVAAGDTITTVNAAQTLSNKLFSTTTDFFADTTTPTKRIGFDTSAGAAATTLTISATQAFSQTLAIPTVAAGDTFVTLNTVQTFVGLKNFSDQAIIFQNNADATKQMHFQLSGITTGTTVVLTVPNHNDTIAVLSLAQTLFAKTITDSASNVIARSLWVGSGAGSVSTFAATAPTAGQALIASSAALATWQSFATGTTGSDFNIVSAGASAPTFNIPDASTVNRGLVTAGNQTFGGSKTFNNAADVIANFTLHSYFFTTGTVPTVSNISNVALVTDAVVTASITPDATNEAGHVRFVASAPGLFQARITYSAAITGSANSYPMITATSSGSIYSNLVFVFAATTTSFDVRGTAPGAGGTVDFNYFLVNTS